MQAAPVGAEAPRDLLTFRRLDATQPRELLALMRDIANENGSHKSAILDENLWRWQYAELPTKESRVCGAFDGARLVGYYHSPIYATTVDGRAAKVAVPQDVAVSASMRGQGLFRRLATFATEDLASGGVDLAYTFPNANSIRTFLKYNGYSKLKTLDAWVLPVDVGVLAASRVKMPGIGALAGLLNPALGFVTRGVLARGVAPASSIVIETTPSPATQATFDAFHREQAIQVVRSPEFLAWRFGARPQAMFRFATYRRGGDVSAVVVCKRDVIFGVVTLLVMDLAYLPGREADIASLLVGLGTRGPRDLGWAYGLMFAAGTGPAFDNLPRAGFVAVPERFNPRPLNLLVRDFRLDRRERVNDPRAWHVALADWDVF